MATSLRTIAMLTLPELDRYHQQCLFARTELGKPLNDEQKVYVATCVKATRRAELEQLRRLGMTRV